MAGNAADQNADACSLRLDVSEDNVIQDADGLGRVPWTESFQPPAEADKDRRVYVRHLNVGDHDIFQMRPINGEQLNTAQARRR